ncbi:unnamed protein product, partial [Polarella glacialis]
ALARQLSELSEGLEQQLRFRFPGSNLVPTLAELRDVSGSTAFAAAAGAVTSLEVLSEGLGAGGPTNFAEFDCAAPVAFTLDAAAYVAPGCK